MIHRRVIAMLLAAFLLVGAFSFSSLASNDGAAPDAAGAEDEIFAGGVPAEDRDADLAKSPSNSVAGKKGSAPEKAPESDKGSAPVGRSHEPAKQDDAPNSAPEGAAGGMPAGVSTKEMPTAGTDAESVSSEGDQLDAGKIDDGGVGETGSESGSGDSPAAEDLVASVPDTLSDTASIGHSVTDGKTLPEIGEREGAEPENALEPDEAQMPMPEVLRAVGPVVKTHTFVFHVDDSVYETIILKGEESLSQPANPRQDGKRFCGWYRDAAFEEPFEGFGQTPEMDDGVTELYARLDAVYYITYYDNKEQVILSLEMTPGASYTINSAYPAFEVDTLTQRVMGWKDQNGAEYNSDTIQVAGDLYLRPILKTGYTARFDTQGGEAEITQFVPKGEKVLRPKDPERKGYAFAGWFNMVEGGDAFIFDQELEDNVTIYARWVPGETEYCLVYMVQDAEVWNKYTFHSSYLKKGITGEEPDVEEADLKYIDEVFRDGGYKTYFFNGNKTRNLMPQAGRIQADGSTVATVYMDRIYYNLVSGNKKLVIRWGQTTKNVLKNLTGQAVPDTTIQYHFRYNGKLLLSYKPNDFPTFPTPASLASYNDGGEIPLGAELRFGSKDNFGGANRYKYTKYYETLDSTPEAKDYQEETIERSLKMPDVGFTWYSDEKWKLIKTDDTDVENPPADSIVAHFRGAGTDSKGSFKYASAWYDRVRYDLNMFGLETTTIPDIMWGTELTAFAPEAYVIGTTTKLQDGVKYVFSGWYTDSACADAFSFDGALMPTKVLNLYAGWTPKPQTVTFDPNGGEFDGPEKVTLQYGDKVQEPGTPRREGGTFLEWTYNGSVWDFTSPVTDDITLTAQYFTVEICKVRYNAGEGGGTVEDDNSYFVGASATVRSGDELMPPPDKHFVYWRTQDGGIHRPGTILSLNVGQLTEAEIPYVELTAVYAPDVPRTALIYDLNYASFGIEPPVNYVRDEETARNELNNQKLTLRQPTAEETPKGYSFAGWYLNAACSGTAQERVMIDTRAPLPNAVYAKWTANPNTGYTVEFYYQMEGKYPEEADVLEQREGATDTQVSVTDADKLPARPRYVLDGAAENVFSGRIDGTDGLVLKVYFKQQFTIIFDLNGGRMNNGDTMIVETHDYGHVITIPSGATRDGHVFRYWKGSEYWPGERYTVTEDHTFTAQWEQDPTFVPTVVPDSAPLTGDSGIGLWLCLMAASLAGCCVALLGDKQRRARWRAK